MLQKRSLRTRVSITITKDCIIIRESIIPFKKEVAKLENLKRIREMHIWEKKSLELLANEGRIILSGDYENTSEINCLILKILSLQNL
ncbi:MAG: hypothetical protein KAT16_02295 [Candidatus Heimdallarchaeota archaeon]|nr:hypothetical protein [Candidatus Heimdallarchaeota archaeon]